MIDHLSVSQVKLYLLCPLKYFYRYVARLSAPQSSELTLGRSVHAALETNFRQKVTSQQDLPLSHVTDAFSDAWEQEARQTAFEDGEKPEQVKQDLQLTAYSLAHQTIQGQPEASLRLDVAVRNKTPRILHLETIRQPTDHARFL